MNQVHFLFVFLTSIHCVNIYFHILGFYAGATGSGASMKQSKMQSRSFPELSEATSVQKQHMRPFHNGNKPSRLPVTSRWVKINVVIRIVENIEEICDDFCLQL